MTTADPAFGYALQHHQAGWLAEAEALYRQILVAQPNHAEARHFLGVLAHQCGRHELAREWIQQSLQLNPNNATAHSNLGEVYRAMGRLDEAITAYRRALALQPDHAQAPFNLANALLEKRQFDEAIAVCQRALEFHPHAPTGHLNLGNIFKDTSDFDRAIASFRRALELQPDYAEAANNLGVALRRCGRLAEATAAFRRALELKPGYPEASNNLGNVLRDQGRLGEAVAAYHRAIEIDAQHAEAFANLCVVRAEEGRYDEGVAAGRRAVDLRPNLLEAHLNLGAALTEQGDLDSALAALQRALELDPNDSKVHAILGNVYKDQGRIDEAIAAYRHARELAPDFVAAHDNLIYALHYQPGIKHRAIAEEQSRWNRQFSDPAKQSIRPNANDRNPERPLRVGYVSADFWEHVVGRNIRPLFRNHDRRGFQIFCFAGVVRPDGLTDEFRECADRWRSTVGLTDEALADVIREDEVDILVDLAQHTAGNRLTMFARRAAPVQVSFAGYPESAGVEAIGYRISDRYLEGGAASQKRWDHEEVCLIDSFWCYDPCGMDLLPNVLPASAKGWLTFGSLNNFCKVNAGVLQLWARVLGTVKDSRLVLLSARGSHRQRTLEVLERAGVKADRVEFVEPCPRRAYLALYQRLDVVLDPFPYNGHTTSLDALWMGVPVVSLAGERAVSRAGLSQLTNLGLRELVAFSEDEYVEIAVRLARDLPRLAELRRTLRARMEASVLMDAKRFARGIEAAYRTMWRQWCMGNTRER